MDRGIDMISVEVSRDVPVPPLKRRYPYVDMDIGDSFVMPAGSSM